jgi:acetyl-CoA C-acetyltransferase
MVYIIGYARTPIGSFLGSLSSKTAVQLGVVAAQAALQRSRVPLNHIEEVYFGNVLSANLGQHPARQVALGCGLDASTPATNVNKVCASGLKAIVFAAQSIQLGHAQVILAGGMESMSNAPHYLPKSRTGTKFGNVEMVDAVSRDGLNDAYDNSAMGMAAEACAKQHAITREEQDDFTIRSYQLAQRATKEGLFVDEIVAVELEQGRGKPTILFSMDEETVKFDPVKLRQLKPAFVKDGTGTVTAASSTPLSDGAAAVVLCSEEYLKELQATTSEPIQAYRILGYADAAKAPIEFTTAPSLALPKALERANLTKDDLAAIELNEAFAVVGVANTKLMGLNPDVVNTHGGAVAMGHPLGCSGTRIVVTLMGRLHHLTRGSKGAAAICNGGGGASALILEKAFD